ncbi:MAG: proprotein convertase P-domain-containing protein [Gammaproteobacteria bacterium]|nr:proprotein convertase P-domain-containing protein [Gammaproteobacteria bacterium]
MNAHRSLTWLALALIGASPLVASAAESSPAAPWRPVATGQALDALAREAALVAHKQAASQPVAPTAGDSPREILNITVPEFMRAVKPVKTKADPLAAKQRAAAKRWFEASRITGQSVNAPGVLISAPGYSSDNNAAINGGRVAPPDTNGDVGPQHYVQYVNLGWLALNKTDGSIASGPHKGNTFWAGFGGVCETANAGDPIVLYDHLSGRWMFSQFTPITGGKGHQCFAISKTGQPFPSAGESAADHYHRYDFIVDDNGFNDYPKIGLWTDGYYMTTNHFNASLTSYTGTRVTVFDRAKMVAGDASAGFVQFDMGTNDSFSIQPAHLEGLDTPPAGTCGLLVHASDAEIFRSAADPDTYRLWRACADFATPGNSTITEQPRIVASEFDGELCGFDECIPQPTGQSLDTLSQFTMYRFTARYFPGSGLKGVISHSVDLGANKAGVRWAEFNLDAAGTGHSLADEGTIDMGDSQNRWMPAAGMDASGNLGFVYSRGNASTFASVYYTGREVGDPAGTVKPEASCVDATGGQTGASRWGDYASMSIDPVDQCTFWMTNEYVETTGTFDWNTRVCSFRFENCGEPTFSLAGDNLSQKVCTTTGASLAPVNLTIGSVQGYSTPVDLSYASLPAGFSGGFSATPVTPPGTSVASITADSSVASGQYVLGIRGMSGSIQRDLTVNVRAYAAAPAAIALTNPLNGAGGQALRPSFSWNGNGEAVDYTIEIATDAAFGNIVVSATVSGTSFTPAADLQPNKEYFWRVRGNNSCGGGAYSPAFSFSTGLLFCATPDLNIPDGSAAGVTSSLNVALGGNTTLTDMNVNLKADHTWVGDLSFKLKHVASGTEVVLIDRPGVPGSSFGCSRDNVDASMDDEGARPVETTCDTTGAALSGALVPEQPLTALDGKSLAGAWELNVSDQAAIDTGKLVQWCLVPSLAALVGDFDGDRCVDIDDMAILLKAIREKSTDPKYDLNGDGKVDNKDRTKLTTLYTNPGGARCP